MLSSIDRRIIAAASKDLALAERPFEILAHSLGIKEDTLLERMRYFRKRKILRKYSAALNHINAGFKYNAMVVWDVPERFVKKAGGIMSSYEAVSHCYQRERACGWNYNLYSMIHGKTKKGCLSVVRDISEKTGFNNYRILFSSKEYKKTGVKY